MVALLPLIAACSSSDPPSTPGDPDAAASAPPPGVAPPGAPPPPGNRDGGTTSDGGSVQNGPTTWCENRGGDCVCGKDKNWFPNGTATTPCSRATTSANAWCCASNDWPNAGGCSCVTNGANCHRTPSKTCICSLAKPDTGDVPVASCTGKLCCNDPGNIAPTCACYDNLAQCVFGTPVPSCDTSTLKCDGRKIDDCR